MYFAPCIGSTVSQRYTAVLYIFGWYLYGHWYTRHNFIAWNSKICECISSNRTILFNTYAVWCTLCIEHCTMANWTKQHYVLHYYGTKSCSATYYIHHVHTENEHVAESIGDIKFWLTTNWMKCIGKKIAAATAAQQQQRK